MKNSQRPADYSARVGNEGRSQTRPSAREQRPPKTLTRLVARRSWFEIENLLSSSSIDWMNIDEKGLITDESILQFALRYSAPLRIVKLLALRYPRCLTRPDSTGKYSCQVASKYGASPNVMYFLVCKNKYAAAIQDPLGKCPIHYVAEFYACNNESETDVAVKEDMLQVVRILRDAAPQSFYLEDDEGCNAIEHAIFNNVDIKIIRTKQPAARDDWRALKASGHGKRHEELAQDIERSASEARMNVRQDHTSDSSDNQFKSFVAKSAT
mmetsp:Transcript_19742/g.42342  ORF Transcript_19742/g.42342 Transcript_19742/m.42342 type:complete len:269 (-) Transcript_19742:68-874(-)